MKVWITKYALTKGIFTLEVEVCTQNASLVYATKPGPLQEREYYGKPYWHETLDEAREHAEGMRVRKIASLRKQIAKLQELKFGGAS